MNYAIKTYGCKLNQAETGNLKKVLRDLNHVKPENAELIIINSCGIINKTERKILKEIKKWKSRNKKVMITGCLPSINENVEKEVDIAMKGNNPEIFRLKLSELCSLKSDVRKKISTIRKKESASVIIPASTGCLGSCSYCSAKIARGKLNSYPAKEIVKVVREELKKGAKEIQLTSQDLGVYGIDLEKTSLINLVEKILRIDNDFKLKLGMMNPGHIKESMNEFLSLFKDDRLYKFLHIPVQSGSISTLKKMNRNHSVVDFVEIADSIRDQHKDFLLATDIIVGFPGETEKDFKKTIELIKRTRPHIINITRYSERKGTPASKLKDMPSKIKKERSRKLTELGKEIRLADNQKMVGKKFRALIYKKGKKETKLARIFNGKAVVLPEGKIGKIEDIKIVDYKHNYLIGNVEP